jgi:outer membrane protein OmpA-like peptidoglycan-associated protein
MRRLIRPMLALLLAVQCGCGVFHKPSWNKPWGRGTWIPALVCGAVGAGVGVAIQDARTGTSTIRVDGETVVKVEDDKEYWKGAVIGAPAGALLCALLGHVFIDPPPPELPQPPPPIVAEEPAATTVAPPATTVKRIVLRGVNFDYDSSEIRPVDRPVLDEAVRQLTDQTQIALAIEGHTDSRGTDQYNQALSVRRAEAVFRYLVNKGLAPERMRAEGFGESRPVADNETDAGRAQNRRVELRVLK